MSALVEASEQNGIWTLQAGILAENTVSIHLHQQTGFRVVGTRERIGCLDGRWRDTVLMERRSAVVGGLETMFHHETSEASLRAGLRHLCVEW